MKHYSLLLLVALVMLAGMVMSFAMGLVAVSDQPSAATSYVMADKAPLATYSLTPDLDDLLSAKLWEGEYDTQSSAAGAAASWYRIGIVQRSSVNPASVRIIFDPGVLSTPSVPSPTAIPSTEPSATVPSPTLTRTPSATPTKKPTATRTATPTVTDDAPPQETLDPNEPTPEPGEEKVCLVRNLSNGPFNIRADHVNDATITGQVPTSEYAAVDRIFVIDTGIDEWFHVAHTRANGVVIRGWMHWTKTAGLEFPSADTDDLCWELPVEQAGGTTPTRTPVPTQTGPTATAQPPIILGCDVWNPTAGNINVRSGPGLSYAVIEKFTPGESGIALRVHVVSTSEEWVNFSQLSSGGQNTYGYIALKIGGSALAALRGDSCPDVPRVAASIRVGWHLTQGAQWNPLASTAKDYGAVKSTDLTAGVAQTFKQVNPGSLWVHRSIFGSGGAFNCPTFEWTSPGVWVDRYRYTWPSGADFVELINECQTGPGGATFNNFIIESTRYANSLGFCVLVFSFAAGTPDYPEWSALVPVLRFLDANPCKVVNGKPIYNGIALHGAFCSGPDMMSNEWTRETHICDRHMYVRNELLKATGYDLYNFKGPIVLSEIGTDGGYGGTSSDPTWPTGEWLKVVDYTLDLYESEGLIDAIILWNLGDGGAGQWISREYWIEPLAALLRSRAGR